jgi:hypothetical protein
MLRYLKLRYVMFSRLNRKTLEPNQALNGHDVFQTTLPPTVTCIYILNIYGNTAFWTTVYICSYRAEENQISHFGNILRSLLVALIFI